MFPDLKLHLQSTDYGNFLANVPSPLQVSVIDDKLREKFVTEFQHMRNHSTGALATFLDFITYRRVVRFAPESGVPNSRSSILCSGLLFPQIL